LLTYWKPPAERSQSTGRSAEAWDTNLSSRFRISLWLVTARDIRGAFQPHHEEKGTDDEALVL